MTTYPALSKSDPSQFSFAEGEDGWGFRDRRLIIFCSTDCRTRYLELAGEQFEWLSFETTRTQGLAADGSLDSFGPRCSTCGAGLAEEEVSA